MKTTEKEYILDPAGVDAISEDCRAFMTACGVQRESVLRVRLTAEELLIRVMEHYEAPLSVTLRLGRRLGRPAIRIRYRADGFNPIPAGEDEMGEWSGQILSSLGLAPSWSYRGGVNELMLRPAAADHRSELVLAAAVASAVVLGLLGPRLPAPVITVVSTYVLGPVSDAFLRLLSTCVGLLVFLSVTSGICGIGSAAEVTRLGKVLVKRSLGLSFLESAAMLLLLLPFFTLRSGAAGGDISQLGTLVDMLLDIIPSNPVQPFSEGNTLQIIFMAALVGGILLATGSRSEHFRDFTLDFNTVVMQAIELVCRLLPLYIFASLTLEFWSNGAAALLGLWKPIALCAAVCALFFAVKTCVVAVRLNVPARVLVSKAAPGMLVGYATASSSSAFAVCSRQNEKALGISPKLSRVGIPVGNILYQSVYTCLFIIVVYYAAELYGTEVNPVWFLILWLSGTILSIAAPPVAGGALACFSILSSQLGIPEESLPLMATLNVLLDFICTGSKLGMMHLELILEADKLDLLDREMLRGSGR